MFDISVLLSIYGLWVMFGFEPRELQSKYRLHLNVMTPGNTALTQSLFRRDEKKHERMGLGDLLGLLSYKQQQPTSEDIPEVVTGLQPQSRKTQRGRGSRAGSNFRPFLPFLIEGGGGGVGDKVMFKLSWGEVQLQLLLPHTQATFTFFTCWVWGAFLSLFSHSVVPADPYFS